MSVLTWIAIPKRVLEAAKDSVSDEYASPIALALLSAPELDPELVEAVREADEAFKAAALVNAANIESRLATGTHEPHEADMWRQILENERAASEHVPARIGIGTEDADETDFRCAEARAALADAILAQLAKSP